MRRRGCGPGAGGAGLPGHSAVPGPGPRPVLPFRRARALQRPGGFLLVSGIFRKADTPEFEGNYVERQYIEQAASHGLRLTRRVDISANTLPTIAAAADLYSTYAPPVRQLAGQLLGTGGSLKLKLLRWAFNGEAARLERLVQHVEERFDVELYDRRTRYVRLLLRTEGD